MPVRAQVIVVDASNHNGWDPGLDFWMSLHHREEAPPYCLSACETFRACPDCDGDVGVVEGAPSHASSDVELRDRFFFGGAIVEFALGSLALPSCLRQPAADY